MKSVSFLLICSILLITIPCSAKRPKQKPKPDTYQIIDDQDEQKESPNYQPNPVILAGVGQIMNGALSIAQNPHSRPNLGHSIATMIHGIISIIIEKVAHKKIDITDQQALEDCFDEVCFDISKEITEIIATKNFEIDFERIT